MKLYASCFHLLRRYEVQKKTESSILFFSGIASFFLLLWQTCIAYLAFMKLSLANDTCLLSVDSFGGAIVDFHLTDGEKTNPFSFAFTKEQMPDNNREGAPYRGHFLCAGRWGLPSEGEIKMGLPNHGEAANIQWQAEQKNNYILMQADATKEGLRIERTIELDEQESVFAVSECFLNTYSLGRLYNIVQHPTLAAPFLTPSTVVNCNATLGFDQLQYKNAEENKFQFPMAKDDKGNAFNLQHPQVLYNSVFSFIVNKNSQLGWLTAYSPTHQLLLGYVWKRSDYPWIHLWQHWDDNKLIYRGIEFGTAGIHQPFEEILNTATHLFGEKTFAYIDAGECICKQYFSFIYKTEQSFTGVKKVTVTESSILITTEENYTIHLATSINLIHELSE